jgi:putative membrane protein
VAAWPYVVLGAGYATLAVGLLVMGARRQRQLERAIDSGSQVPLSFHVITAVHGRRRGARAHTMVLVIAQT